MDKQHSARCRSAAGAICGLGASCHASLPSAYPRITPAHPTICMTRWVISMVPVRPSLSEGCGPRRFLSRLVALRLSSYNSCSPNHLHDPMGHFDGPGSPVVIRGLRASALLAPAAAVVTAAAAAVAVVAAAGPQYDEQNDDTAAAVAAE